MYMTKSSESRNFDGEGGGICELPKIYTYSGVKS